ncbi:hypothetical protein WA158_001104 [Blastocystis sp. Blastoise]
MVTSASNNLIKDTMKQQLDENAANKENIIIKEENLESYSYNTLRQWLKTKNESAKGTKDELIQRIKVLLEKKEQLSTKGDTKPSMDSILKENKRRNSIASAHNASFSEQLSFVTPKKRVATRLSKTTIKPSVTKTKRRKSCGSTPLMSDEEYTRWIDNMRSMFDKIDNFEIPTE